MEQWLRADISFFSDNLANNRSNQSDANFGLAAAVAESLLQSHADEISLLPALPPSWSNGSIDGLRARGGFEVAMQWKDGKLLSATIHNRTASRFNVRYAGKTATLSIQAGQTIRLNADLSLIQ